MRRWPGEVIAWLRENAPGRTTREVTELIKQQDFEERYGIVFTESIIKGAKSRYHIRSGTKGGNPKGYSPKYPEGMEDFIRRIADGKSTEELVAAVNEKYGEGTIGIRQMRAYKKNHDIKTGLDCRFEPGHTPANKGKKMSSEVYAKVASTMFKKGSVPANKMKVGEYTHTTDGYLVQKVREDGTQRERFEFVHRLVWEQHNGPIPPDKMISFLDGNKDNCEIENLVLIDRAENLELTRSGLRCSDAELTRTGVMVAKLKVSAREKKRRKCRNG